MGRGRRRKDDQDPEEREIRRELEKEIRELEDNPRDPELTSDEVAEHWELSRRSQDLEQQIQDAADDMIRAAYRMDLKAYQKARRRRDDLRDMSSMVTDRRRILARKARRRSDEDLQREYHLDLFSDIDSELDPIIDEMERGQEGPEDQTGQERR